MHTAKVTATLGLDSDKILAIYPEFGNVGPAAIPMALSKSIDAGRVRKGSRVALLGIGSGLNCAMMEVAW